MTGLFDRRKVAILVLIDLMALRHNAQHGAGPRRPAIRRSIAAE
jgi:hypothetical protein